MGIEIGDSVKSRSDLSPVNIFSLLMQGIKLNTEYTVIDTKFYLGRNYIKFNESRHWQSEEWFAVVNHSSLPKVGFLIED